MLVYIQWTRGANPQDWQAYDLQSLTDWRRLPQKSEPGPGVTGLMAYQHPEYGEVWVPDPNHPTADTEGWIYDMSIAGVMMSGADHHYAGRDGPRISYVRWNDDVEWATLGDRFAQQWSFGMPVVDTELGVLQPDVRLTVWAESAARRAIYTDRWMGRPPARTAITVLDWAQFTPPGPANMVRHGIWVTPEQEAAHEAARTFIPTFPGWASLTGP